MFDLYSPPSITFMSLSLTYAVQSLKKTDALEFLSKMKLVVIQAVLSQRCGDRNYHSEQKYAFLRKGNPVHNVKIAVFKNIPILYHIVLKLNVLTFL